MQKRNDEALQEFKRALNLDPLSLIINTNYAVALMIARQYDLAEIQFKHTQELDPNFKVLNTRYAQFLSFRGKFEEAKALYEKSGFLGSVQWQPGREGFYRSLLSASVTNPTVEDLGLFASTALGDKQQAIRSLKRMADEDPGDADIFIRRPEFDSLHSEPEFQRLLSSMKLQP